MQDSAPLLTTQKAWAIATQAKDNQPCTDCGVAYRYWVMQLDHIASRGPKAFTISAAYTTDKARRAYCTEAQLRDEIAKCEIVCSNCHAERTHARGGQRWGRPLVIE